MSANKNSKIIGSAEVITFPEISHKSTHARIDTGARTSAIWGDAKISRDGALVVTFFGKDHKAFTGKAYTFSEYTTMAVASSNGHIQQRYAVKILVRLGGKKIRATFTIADRSTQVYAVLIGRNVLRGKFIVDVKQGNILSKEERHRIAVLQEMIDKDKGASI